MKLSIPFIRDKSKGTRNDVNSLLAEIKNGNLTLKNKFISDYKPFILKSVFNTTGKNIEAENSEEFSIGLMAFNEAIDSFDETKNRNFFGFSEQVIKRRLIDHMRKNRQDSKKLIPFTYLESEDSKSFEEKYLQSDKPDQYANIELKEELLAFKKKLGEYGITMRDLVSCAPRHRDSRILCIRIARVLAGDSVLYSKLEKTKTLPIKELLQVVSVYRGTLDKNRRFIIAICLIIKSGLEVMKGYIEQTEEGRDINE